MKKTVDYADLATRAAFAADDEESTPKLPVRDLEFAIDECPQYLPRETWTAFIERFGGRVVDELAESTDIFLTDCNYDESAVHRLLGRNSKVLFITEEDFLNVAANNKLI